MIMRNVQKKENRKNSSAKTGGDVKSAIHGTRSLMSEEAVEPGDDEMVVGVGTSLSPSPSSSQMLSLTLEMMFAVEGGDETASLELLAFAAE